MVSKGVSEPSKRRFSGIHGTWKSQEYVHNQHRVHFRHSLDERWSLKHSLHPLRIKFRHGKEVWIQMFPKLFCHLVRIPIENLPSGGSQASFSVIISKTRQQNVDFFRKNFGKVLGLPTTPRGTLELLW